jgi:hypothetical protein
MAFNVRIKIGIPVDILDEARIVAQRKGVELEQVLQAWMLKGAEAVREGIGEPGTELTS